MKAGIETERSSCSQFLSALSCIELYNPYNQIVSGLYFNSYIFT